MIVDYLAKNYKGYYLANPEDYVNNWSDKNKYPQVPDLKTKSSLFSVLFVCNPDKYFANAAFSFKKTKRQSGGSFILRGFTNRNSVVSDTSIIPQIIKQYVDPGLQLKSITTTDIGLSLGYSYILAIPGNHFASLTLSQGVSFQQAVEQSSIDESIKKNNLITPQTTFNVSIGHNAERYYWGVVTHFESANAGSVISMELERIGLFFIYRLDTSGWKFMKGIDKVMHPRGLRFIFGDPPGRD